mgnify:CR=1 FL=1
MNELSRLNKLLQLIVEQTFSVTTSQGVDVPIGSDDHISDLRHILLGVQHVRDQYPRASANRAVYARACNQLSNYIRKLQKHNAQQSSASLE